LVRFTGRKINSNQVNYLIEAIGSKNKLAMSQGETMSDPRKYKWYRQRKKRGFD
jgi:hypothetical protein